MELNRLSSNLSAKELRRNIGKLIIDSESHDLRMTSLPRDLIYSNPLIKSKTSKQPAPSHLATTQVGRALQQQTYPIINEAKVRFY